MYVRKRTMPIEGRSSTNTKQNNEERKEIYQRTETASFRAARIPRTLGTQGRDGLAMCKINKLSTAQVAFI